MTDLSAVFRPRAIAVVGASDDPVKIGGRPLALCAMATRGACFRSIRRGPPCRACPPSPRSARSRRRWTWPSSWCPPSACSSRSRRLRPRACARPSCSAAAARAGRAHRPAHHRAQLPGLRPPPLAPGRHLRLAVPRSRARHRAHRNGQPLALGVKVDPVFGPVVLVGSGGVLIEVLRGLRVGPLWDGVRGGTPLDLPAAVELLQRLGEAARGLGAAVSEIDLNPVLVGRRGEGVTILDTLVRR